MENQSDNKTSQWNILKLLTWTTSYFKSLKIENPRAAAELLLAHTLDVNRIDLYVNHDQPLCKEELDRFKAYIRRRARREPVAYIVGHKEFWSRDLIVNRDVLVPRPETECLVEAVLGYLNQTATDSPVSESQWVLELGTGSGAIIMALAAERPGHVFFASDISRPAVQLARDNSRRQGFDRQINYWVGNWFDALDPNRQKFDMIISNPPYIKTGEIRQLQPEIHQYEPVHALDGGEDGLDCLRQILSAGGSFLKKEGSILLEIGHDQKDSLQEITDQCGTYDRVDFKKDYQGQDRVAIIMKR